MTTTSAKTEGLRSKGPDRRWGLCLTFIIVLAGTSLGHAYLPTGPASPILQHPAAALAALPLSVDSLSQELAHAIGPEDSFVMSDTPRGAAARASLYMRSTTALHGVRITSLELSQHSLEAGIVRRVHAVARGVANPGQLAAWLAELERSQPLVQLDCLLVRRSSVTNAPGPHLAFEAVVEIMYLLVDEVGP